MLNPSDNPPEQPHHLRLLHNLIDNHPIVLWGGISTTLVVVCSLAAVNLLYPGPIEPEASVPSPTLSTIQESVAAPEASVPAPVSEPVRERVGKSTDKKNLPLSLFGGIAIGCAVGSLLVTQALRQTTQSRQSSKRLKPSATARKKRRQPSKGYPPAPVPRTPQTGVPNPNFQTLNSQLATTNNSLSRVTVLPPEENHPLDGGHESLADMMDLRKRHSLASLMRDR